MDIIIEIILERRPAGISPFHRNNYLTTSDFVLVVLKVIITRGYSMEYISATPH